jgi:hypothetical protein
MSAAPQLTCYHLGYLPGMKLVPASPFRKWMDEFPERHAYRCLPLSIANAHAWDLLCPFGVEIAWSGGPEAKDIQIHATENIAPLTVEHFCKSNFTRGIVTFHTDFIFVTGSDWNIYASGPVNQFKDGVQPLTGIIETSWLPYPFTMNYQLTRPGIFRFQRDEPFCSIMPIPRDYLQDVTPQVLDIKDNPELMENHRLFRENREAFMKKFNAGDAATLQQGWQRLYFSGRLADGSVAEQHTNKLRLNAPERAEPPKKA